jgi:hypothetical protein
MAVNIITNREESRLVHSSVGPLVPQGGGKEVYLFDVALMSGEVGLYSLRGNPLPQGAILTNSYIQVITALTSTNSTSNVAVSVEAAGDIATAAVSGAPWSTTGLKDTVNPEPGLESSYIKTTVIRWPSVAITVEKLLTGKFQVVLEYDILPV